MQVVWTDPALERVDEIGVYIARDDPDAAARWTVELFNAVARLVDFPESGRTVPELGARDVRELIFGAYRVFYRVGPAVEVLSVRHTGVSWSARKTSTGTDRQAHQPDAPGVVCTPRTFGVVDSG